MTRSFIFKWKDIFCSGCCFPLQKFQIIFIIRSFLLNTHTRNIFTTHVVLYFKNKKIRLINPQISKKQIHNFTSNHGRECCIPFTLEMCYGWISPHRSSIVNPSITSKPRWCAGFGWNTMKYAFCVTTSESGGVSQGDTQIKIGIDR